MNMKGQNKSGAPRNDESEAKLVYNSIQSTPDNQIFKRNQKKVQVIWRRARGVCKNRGLSSHFF